MPERGGKAEGKSPLKSLPRTLDQQNSEVNSVVPPAKGLSGIRNNIVGTPYSNP